MAVALVLNGIFVSLSCCFKATLGEEIAEGLLMIILRSVVGLFL